MDTCGAFYIPGIIRDMLVHLSVGPKPGLPLWTDVVGPADELRYYTNSADDIFQDFIEASMPLSDKALVIPYTLDQAEIDFGLEFCIARDLRFHIPLYRALPTFDANRNGGKICDICLLQDSPKLEAAITYKGVSIPVADLPRA
jgi:hypothetical protein